MGLMPWPPWWDKINEYFLPSITLASARVLTYVLSCHLVLCPVWGTCSWLLNQIGHVWDGLITTWFKTILGLVSLLTGWNWAFKCSSSPPSLQLQELQSEQCSCLPWGSLPPVQDMEWIKIFCLYIGVVIWKLLWHLNNPLDIDT